MIEANIFTALSTAAGILAVIPSTQIYPVELPENPQLPAMAYKIVGGNAKPTFSSSGMKRLRLQLDCYGATYLSAAGLRWAAIQSLDGYVDANINAQLLQSLDVFRAAPRQYCAVVEFYVFYGS